MLCFALPCLVFTASTSTGYYSMVPDGIRLGLQIWPADWPYQGWLSRSHAGNGYADDLGTPIIYLLQYYHSSIGLPAPCHPATLPPCQDDGIGIAPTSGPSNPCVDRWNEVHTARTCLTQETRVGHASRASHYGLGEIHASEGIVCPLTTC